MHLIDRGRLYNYPQASSQSNHQDRAENWQLQETHEDDAHQSPLPTDRQASNSWQSQLSANWSKFIALFQTTSIPSPIEPLEAAPTESSDGSNSGQEMYPYFVDRVDPSFYYTVFFPPF